MDLSLMNWPAVLIGTVLAFALGMLWYSPRMFGKVWSRGSHNIQPPKSAPMLAMGVQFLGTFVLALVVGITATTDALFTAIFAILAAALLVSGAGLFSQKSVPAVWVDFGYIFVCGVVLIGMQGAL